MFSTNRSYFFKIVEGTASGCAQSGGNEEGNVSLSCVGLDRLVNESVSELKEGTVSIMANCDIYIIDHT